MEPGDTLVMYTDGLTEAMNEQREIFGEERLWSVIEANGDKDAQAMMEAILGAVEDFVKEVARSDDLTLIVLKREDL